MEAFDAMPAEWRRFCAEYGRTASGVSLAYLLKEQCGGDMEAAKEVLTASLPLAEPPPLLPPQKPWRTLIPPVSQQQRKLMWAAASKKGGVGGVPQSVGKEFAEADKPGKLPKRVKGGKPVKRAK